PGHTSLTQSIMLLESHPYIRQFTSRQQYETTDGWGESRELVIFASPGAMVIVSAQNADAKVVSIGFVVERDHLTGMGWAALGRVIADLGPPTFFSANTEMTQAYYVSQNMVISHTHVSSGWYTINDQFSWLYMYDEEYAIAAPSLPWRGWVS